MASCLLFFDVLYVYLIDKIKHAYLFVDKHLNVLWRLASLNVIKSLNHVEYALQTAAAASELA